MKNVKITDILLKKIMEMNVIKHQKNVLIKENLYLMMNVILNVLKIQMILIMIDFVNVKIIIIIQNLINIHV